MDTSVAAAPSPSAIAPRGAGKDRPPIDVTRIAALPARQALGLMVGLAALIAFAIGGWMWAQAPDWRVLYSNLSDRDGGAVVAALGTMNVPYKIAEGGGAIMVPSAQVHDTRLKLASQGLPKGSVVGYELVDAQKFGATQFQEQINFQRGLEGELARSIQSLAAVAGARVHLAIPKPSVFTRETSSPTASVLVTLHPGRTLDRAQVNGIVHLVASSVPELAVDRVSVLDQNGALLSQRRDADGGLDATQLAYVKQLEQATIQRIVDILEPIVGRGNVRAQVTADVDFRRVESVAETYKPNQDPKLSAVRTQQTAESMQQGAGAGAQGVPGALTNQPPANATAPIEGRPATPTAATGTANSGPLSTRKDASVAYEIDKTIQHTRGPSAGLRRLSAAVIVNHKRATPDAKAADPKGDGKGDAKSDGKAADARPGLTARSPQEMEQIQSLVREAMGFSQDRGDSLSVANAPFSEPEAAPAVETPWWKSADTIATAKETAKYAAYAALLAWLWFGVARPMLRRASTPIAEPVIDTGPAEDVAPMSPRAGVPPAVDSLTRARQVAREDPKIVANVVRSWVTKDE